MLESNLDLMFILVDGVVVGGSVIRGVPIEDKFPVIETTNATFSFATTQVTILDAKEEEND